MAFQTRYAEIRDSQPSVSDRHPPLGTKLDALRRISDEQYAAAKAFLAISPLYPTDMLLMSLVSRSLDVIDAFARSFDRWNVAVSSPLVRLQVDNVLRAHLVATTPDTHELLLHLAGDKRLDRLTVPPVLAARLPERFHKRPRFTDAVLVELASAEHDWIRDSYKTASAWVHHSAAHLLTTWKVSDEGQFSGRIPVDVDQFSVDFLEPLLDTMGVSSRALLAYLTEWVEKKPREASNPLT